MTKDLSSVMSWLDKNVWLPGKWEAPRETTITRKRDGKELTSKTTSQGNLEGYEITEKIVTQTMKKYNKTREEVLAEYAKLGADISEVK